MYATDYVKERQAFGQTIADFQGIRWEIAKCATDIEAARLLTYRAAWLADQGMYAKEHVPMLSMAKYYATEVAVKASGLGRAATRSSWIHARPPRRAVLPRREATHDCRRYEPDAARPDRTRRCASRPVVGLADAASRAGLKC